MEQHEFVSVNKPRNILIALLLVYGMLVNCEAKTVEEAKQYIRVKNFQEAVLLLDTLAQQGDAEAQYMLAVMYRNGHGVDRDLPRAFGWFLKAAQNKHVKAQYEVGMCYLNGLGVAPDSAQSRVWLGKAAAQNYAQASEQLVLLSGKTDVQKNSGDNFSRAQHAVQTKDNRLLSQLVAHIAINQVDVQGNSLLHTASQFNNQEAAEILLQSGIDRNLRNKNSSTALAIAINENNAAIIQRLLEKARVNDRIESTATPVMLAARNGNDDLVRQLVRLGADLTAKDSRGLNALDYAEKRNHATTKSLLISLGMKPERSQAVDVAAVPVERTEFYKGWTDLMIAAWKGNEQQCRQYLKKDDVNAMDPQGHTALMRAAMKNHGKIIVLLLQNRADINLQNRQGETALYLAAAENRIDAVNVLLQNKSDVDLAAKNNSTALISAARSNHLAVIEVLLASRANTNLQQDNGMTALHWAISNQQDVSAAKLLASGARFDIYDNQGRTALHLAAMQNRPALLDKMIAAGANINSQDTSGYTLLSYVTEYGSASAVASLIRRGADANVASRRGNNTPLMLAADKGLDDSVKVLADKTSDINHKNNHGDTALILAARSGHASIVKILLDHGARANIRNQNKNTALDVARLENRSHVVELLGKQQSSSESFWDIIK
ncbi:MAG: uncharacterized protein QG652_1198 [Pseudomonadota bacterium]|nr:uncharacterized protein [Pseudomonadota bacterium]